MTINPFSSSGLRLLLLLFLHPLTGTVVEVPFSHSLRLLPSRVSSLALQGVFSCPPGCLVPWMMFLAMVLCRVMCPNKGSLRCLTVSNKGSCIPARESTCCLTYSFVLCSMYEIHRSLLKHFFSNVCSRLSVSAVRVQLSHPWRTTDKANGL